MRKPSRKIRSWMISKACQELGKYACHMDDRDLLVYMRNKKPAYVRNINNKVNLNYAYSKAYQVGKYEYLCMLKKHF